MLKFRHNTMKFSSLCSFATSEHQIKHEYRDVYFIRIIGANTSLADDLLKMETLISEKLSCGVYKRVKSLPRLSSAKDIEFYSKCYEEWVNSNYTSINTYTSTRRLPKEILSNALTTVIGVLKKEKVGISSSIEKNFAVKLIYWLDNVCGEFLEKWNENNCLKISAENITSKQEYLFFYMLTLLGIDVLLIQCKGDIDKSYDDFNLSQKTVLGDFNECMIPDFDENKFKTLSKKIPEVVNETKSLPLRMERPEGYKKSKKSQNSNIPAQRMEKSFEELAKLASSIVMISVCDRDGKILGAGSGIMIGKNGYILTNNHVLGGGVFYSVRVEDDDNIYNTTEIIKYHPIFDLAVIRIQRTLNPVPIYNGTQKLVRGQKVVAIGSPMGFFNSVSDGIISGFRNIRDMEMIQFTAPISHGSSGGAVFNMFGEVIGISTAGIDEAQNLNLAVSYEDINNFVKGFI